MGPRGGPQSWFAPDLPGAPKAGCVGDVWDKGRLDQTGIYKCVLTLM